MPASSLLERQKRACKQYTENHSRDLSQECHSVSGVVITKINGAAHGVESGVSHRGLAYGGNPVAPPDHRPNASGPLPLSVD